MCGILGVYNPDKILLEKNILHHRGPDDWGVSYAEYQGRFLTLFQSRLSIIGLGEQGHQPFRKYEEYTLVFNGEIYNYKEIKEKLIQEYQINFTTSTDTEVLYESLIHLGLGNTLALCNGIFTFGFYDKKLGTLSIARDHLGIKPLYYFRNDNTFAFTSEIKSFFELGLTEPRLKKDLLGEYFANGWIYEPDTLFRDIYKLQAGHYGVFNLKNKTFEINKYWDVYFEEKAPCEIDLITKGQTVSDVPIGNYLSGGIDSTLITLALKSDSAFNLNINLRDSESERVKLLEEKFDIKVSKINGINNSLKLYDKLIYHLDEPIADTAIIPAYELARISRENGKIVMISGMGGDEIDGGYSRHLIIKNLSLIKLLKLFPFGMLGKKGKSKRNFARLNAFIKNPVPENYFALTAYLSKSEIDQLVGENWNNDYTEKITGMCRPVEGTKKYFYLDFKGFLASHNLIYMDKASMAASVEVRVPLLDKNLVASFFSEINSIDRFRLKPRLKEMLKEKLGPEYKKNKKEGFRFPYYAWLRNEINWEDVISFFDGLKIINTGVLKTWIEEIKTDIDSVGMKLLYVYTLYRWMILFNVKV